MYNVKTLKNISSDIEKILSLSASDARAIVAYYSAQENTKGVEQVAALNFEYIRRAAAVVGVSLPRDYKKLLKEEKQKRAAAASGNDPIKNTMEEKKSAQRVNDSEKTQGNTQKERTKQKADKIPVEGLQALKFENINNMEGSTDAGALPSDLLPFDFLNTLESMAAAWCADADIENMRKASALQWGAFCMFIGRYIKENRILYDMEKTRARGGSCAYDIKKVDLLIDIWVYLCQKYGKIPLVTDFIYFSGVSDTWFYNGNGHSELSSADGGIVKKLSKIQAAALASGIADGRENPTGKIYLTKAVLGWSDSGGGLPMQEEKQQNINALPLFGDSGAMFNE